MNSAEFEATRADLGLGRGEFADALGVDVRTARRYASGSVPVPRVVSLACQALRSEARERAQKEWAREMLKDIAAMFGVT